MNKRVISLGGEMNPEEWENQQRFKAILGRLMEVGLRSPICDELLEELRILNEEYSRLERRRQLIPYKSL